MLRCLQRKHIDINFDVNYLNNPVSKPTFASKAEANMNIANPSASFGDI